MNDDFIKYINQKLYKGQKNHEEFKNKLQSDPNFVKFIFDKGNFASKGKTIDDFNKELGLSKPSLNDYKSKADAQAKAEFQDSSNVRPVRGGRGAVANKSGLSEQERSRQIMDENFKSGKWNILDFSDDDLNNLYGNKDNVNRKREEAKKERSNLQTQKDDQGYFDVVKDSFAKLTGGAFGTLDSDRGRINITKAMPGVVAPDMYLTEDQILNLKYHPLSKSKDPNDGLNQHLYGIQKTLTNGELLEWEASTDGINKKIQLTGNALEKAQKDLEAVLGKGNLGKLFALSDKAQSNQITKDEAAEYNRLVQQYQESGLGEKYEQLADSYNGLKEELKLLGNDPKYGKLKQLNLLKDAKFIENEARRRKMSKSAIALEEVVNAIGVLPEKAAAIPKDVAMLVGVAGEALTGTEFGATSSQFREAYRSAEDVITSKTQRSGFDKSLKVGDYEVTFDSKTKQPKEVYDKDGYAVTDEKLKNALLEQGLEKYKAGTDLNRNLNFEPLLYGVTETAPDLLLMLPTGSIVSSGFKAIAKGATSVDRVNKFTKVMSNLGTSLGNSSKLAESFSVVPVFAGTTMEDAVKSGKISTPGELFAVTSSKLALEAIAEAFFAGPIGNLATGKGITRKAFTESLEKSLADSIKNFAAGKITKVDFLKNAKKAAGDFLGTNGILGEGIEEAIVSMLEPSVNNMLNHQLDLSFDETELDWDEVASSFIIGAAAGSTMSGLKMFHEMWNYKGNMKDYYKTQLSNVIQHTTEARMKNDVIKYPEAFKSTLDTLIKKNYITQEDATKYSSAIERASKDTEFLKTPKSSIASTILDLNSGTETENNFNIYTRNLAFDLARLELQSESETNSFAKADTVKLADDRRKALKELEKNHYYGVFSHKTPTTIAIENKGKAITDEEFTNLKEAHERVLEEVKATSFNTKNKTMLYENKIQKAVNEVLRNSSTRTEPEKKAAEANIQQAEKQAPVIKQEIEKNELKEKNTNNTITPKETEKLGQIEKNDVDEFFDNLPLVRDKSGKVTLPMDDIQELINTNPTQEEYIAQKVAELKGKAIQANTNLQNQKSANTPSTAEVGVIERYNQSPELKPDEEKLAKTKFGEILNNRLQQAIDNEASPLEIAALGNAIANLSNTSIEDLYQDPEFKAILDDITKSKPAPQQVTKEEFTADKITVTEEDEFSFSEEDVPADAAEHDPLIIEENEFEFPTEDSSDEVIGVPPVPVVEKPTTTVDDILEKIEETDGTIKDKVYATPYQGVDIENYLTVIEYAKEGDPIYFELSNRGTFQVIEIALYFNPKTEKFVEKGKGTTRMMVGTLNSKENQATQQFLAFKMLELKTPNLKSTITAPILARHNRAVYKTENPNDVIERRNISVKELKALTPYMYILGQPYDSSLTEDIGVMKGNNVLPAARYMEEIEEAWQARNYSGVKNPPSIPNKAKLIATLQSRKNVGKVVIIVDDQLLFLDTAKIEEYQEALSALETALDGLEKAPKGQKLSFELANNEIFRKRSGVVPAKAKSEKGNVRGRLIEVYRSKADNEKPFYKLDKDNKEIYYTKQEILDEIKNIRVHIDHDALQNPTDEYLEKLSQVLTVESRVHYPLIYPSVQAAVPIKTKTVKSTSQEKSITKTEDTLETASKEPPKKKGKKERDIDFKLSDAEYEGKVEEAAQYIKDRFPEVAVQISDETLRELVKGTSAAGKKVWGAFHQGMITLASNAGTKIAKHESMHLVFKFFLNPTQQSQVLEELFELNKNKYQGREQEFKDALAHFMQTGQYTKTTEDLFKIEDNQVNYTLKAVEILQSDKAKQDFNWGIKNNKTLKEVLDRLQIPKQQQELFNQEDLDKKVSELENIKKTADKLKTISERRKLATKQDLENSQLIKDIRVDKSQPKELKPNTADNNLAAIMLYGMEMSELQDKGLPEEMLEATTLAYRILNDLMFDIDEIIDFKDELLKYPEYASTLTTNDNPVKAFFENDIFNEVDKLENNQQSLLELLALELTNKYTYTVEVNIAKEDTAISSSRGIDSLYEGTGNNIESFELDGDNYEFLDEDSGVFYLKNNEVITREEFNNALLKSGKKPTQYYSYLTVPGGTNYTENEIATPLITPSIKGHAQFSTDKGIGWFRSDEQTINKNINDDSVEDIDLWSAKTINGKTFIPTKNATKTRRILELQSDLFQKGRDKENLTDTSNNFKEKLVGSLEGEDVYNLEEDKSSNQFLQFLNKNNNWVRFFIKSIIQDSAKKGYEKVLFPTGKTIEKIEGFDRITEEIENFDKEIDWINKQTEENIIIEKYPYTNVEDVTAKTGIDAVKDLRIQKINKDKQHYLDAQKDTLSTINFYENTVADILNKDYGANINKITDEYGNSWLELPIEPTRDTSDISLKSDSDSFYKEQGILVELMEDLSDMFEDYKLSGLINNDSTFATTFPKIAKFINDLFHFIKSNYLIGKSYITNNITIQDLFYQVEKNIIGRNFVGGRKKSVAQLIGKSIDNINPDFKISDWTTLQAYKYSKFLSNNIFNMFLLTNYGSNNLNQVLKDNTNLSFNEVMTIFTSNTDDLKQKWVEYVLDRHDLDEEDFNNFTNLLDDIFTQYSNNEQLKQIVNRQIEDFVGKNKEFDELDIEVETEANILENSTEDTDLSNTQDIDVQTGIAEHVKNQAHVDSKSRASKRLREFFSKIALTTLKNNGDKYSRNNVNDPELYFPEFYSGELIHNKLLNELSDSVDYSDMIKKLNNLSKKYIWALDILGEILNLNSTQILDALEKDELSIPKDALNFPDKYPNMQTWMLKDLYYAIGAQTNQNKIKLLNSPDKKSGKFINAVSNNDFSNIVDAITETLKNLPSEAKADVLSLAKKIKEDLKDGKRSSLDVQKLFINLGYYVDLEFILHLNDNLAFLEERGKPLNNLKAFNSILTGIIFGLENNKIEQITSDISNLAKLLNYYENSSSNLSFLNVKNELEFAHVPSGYLKKEFNKLKSNVKNWVESKTKFNGKNILFQIWNPFYTDVLKYGYDIFEDGFVATEKQTFSGKEFKDYTTQDLVTNSINAFLASREGEGGTGINLKGHAMFHFGVFSNSPKRVILRAPVFNKVELLRKFTDILYGELERVRLANDPKQPLKKFTNLSKNGKIFHIFPELNDVAVYLEGQEDPINIIEYLAGWENASKNVLAPAVSEIVVNGTSLTNQNDKSYYDVVGNILARIMSTNYSNYISYLDKEGILNYKEGKLEPTDKSSLYSEAFSGDNIESYYYNKFYNNVITQLVFGGDPANYKKNGFNDLTDVDITKRFKQLVSPAIVRPVANKNSGDGNLDFIVIDEIEVPDSTFGGVSSISDAGSYHTIERRIELIKADPTADQTIIPVLERINAGTYTFEDLQRSLQPIKPFVFTNTIEHTDNDMVISVPLQLKNSEVLLLPNIAYEVAGEKGYIRPNSISDINNNKYVRPDLAKILFLMERNKVDLAVFKTASKAEIYNVIDLDTVTDNNYNVRTPENYKVTSIPLTEWAEQMLVPEHHLDTKNRDGSQQAKIMTANVDPTFKYTLDNETFVGHAGVNELLGQVEVANVQANIRKVDNKTKDKNGRVDNNKIVKEITDALIDEQASLDVIEAMAIQEDGRPLMPLELLGHKIQQRLNAIFKKVPVFYSKGAALVNQPSVGFINRDEINVNLDDASTEVSKENISFRDDLKMVEGTDNNGNIVIDHWEAMVPVYDSAIYKYINEDGSLKVDGNGKPIIPEHFLHGFFYRIPTEDKYSMYHIKIVKFLPQIQGGTIILPREATTMTGLDFDIDKLYGFFNNSDSKDEYIKPSLSSEEARQNLKLDVYIKLSQTNRFYQSAMRPGSKKRLQDLRNELSSKPASSSFADPKQEAETAIKNIVGTKLVGIFANANAFYNMIQGVVTLRLKDPDSISLQNGDSFYYNTIAAPSEDISRDIAELLFASTEDVKDPVLAPLNINETTSNLLILLVSLTNVKSNGTIEKMSFDDAIKFINSKQVLHDTKRAIENNTQLQFIESPYSKLYKLSSSYGSVIIASKIDTEIGPSFYDVTKATMSIDNILSLAEVAGHYGGIVNTHEILPGKTSLSKIKKLNALRTSLDNEIETFKGLFSFLNINVRNIMDEIASFTLSKTLNPKIQSKLSYYLYDAIIQNIVSNNEVLKGFSITDAFNNLNNFTGDSVRLRNSLIIKNNIAYMRPSTVNNKSSLDDIKNAFSELFEENPEFAEKLATSMIMSGTAFGVNSSTKLIPNEYWKTPTGQMIRKAITLNIDDSVQKYIVKETLINNHFSQIFRKVTDEELTQLKNYGSLSEYEINVIDNKDESYVWIEDKEGNQMLYHKTEKEGWVLHKTKTKDASPNYLIDNILEGYKDTNNTTITSHTSEFEEATAFNFSELLEQQKIDDEIKQSAEFKKFIEEQLSKNPFLMEELTEDEILEIYKKCNDGK